MTLSVTCTTLSQLRKLFSFDCGSVSQPFDFSTSGIPYLGSIWALDILNGLCLLSCFSARGYVTSVSGLSVLINTGSLVNQ